jgi:hypothetical protein
MQKEFQGIRIVTPRVFLDLLSGYGDGQNPVWASAGWAC